MRSYLLSIARGGIILSIAAMFLATTGAQTSEWDSLTLEESETLGTHAAWIIPEGGILHGVSETTGLVCYSDYSVSNIIRITLYKDGSITFRGAHDGSVWRFPRELTTWYETRIHTEKKAYRTADGEDWQISLFLDRVDGTLNTAFYKHEKHRGYRHYRTSTHVCGKTKIRRKF